MYTKPIFENVVCFDVDDTLILWCSDEEPDIFMTNPYKNELDGAVIHKEHVEVLKRHKADGHFVIVWSGGGAEHAKEAIEKIGLEDHVDLIIDKPMQYYDDLDSSKWMKDNSYLGGNIKYGHRNGGPHEVQTRYIKDWVDQY